MAARGCLLALSQDPWVLSKSTRLQAVFLEYRPLPLPAAGGGESKSSIKADPSGGLNCCCLIFVQSHSAVCGLPPSWTLARSTYGKN
jgi:hypothetical protein